MTQHNDAEKKDQAPNKKQQQSAQQSGPKKNPGTDTMDHNQKTDKSGGIADPKAAQGSASDGDSAG